MMTRPPRTLDVTASVMDAATRIREGDFGDVVVLAEGWLYGILTDRDIVVRVLATGDDPWSIRVGDACSRTLTTVSESDGIGDEVRLVCAKVVRRLPILDDDGQLVGIRSLGNLALTCDPESALGDISAATPNT